MFKNLFASSWFGNSKPTPVASPDSGPFTVPGKDSSQLIQVSMKDDSEDFVAIDCRQLSYAEVAKMSKGKKQTTVVAAAPAPTRVRSNQYEVLSDDEPLTESVFLDAAASKRNNKRNNYFIKNKVYKEADRAKGKKKRPARL